MPKLRSVPALEISAAVDSSVFKHNPYKQSVRILIRLLKECTGRVMRVYFGKY